MDLDIEQPSKQQIEALRAEIPLQLHDPQVACVQHEDRAADAVCAECGAWLCRKCAVVEADTLDLCCEACAALRTRRRRRAMPVRLLRSPAFYVATACACAMIAYASGVGNPTVEDLLSRDMARDWFLREAGRLSIDQAERAVRRATVLHGQQKRGSAVLWFELAGKALARAERAWDSEPVAADLRIGQAIMRARAGDHQTGLRMLQTLERQAEVDAERELALTFHRGILALETGATQTGRTDLLTVLARLTPGHGSQRSGIGGGDVVERIVAVYSEDRRSARLKARIRRLCGTALSRTELTEGARAALREHGCALPEETSEAPVPARFQPAPVKTDGDAGHIRVRHFSED